MIAILSCVCIVGVFVAGAALGTQTIGALIILGLCVIGLGTLIAAAETRGFEGQRVINVPAPLTWEKLWLNVVRMALKREAVAGNERVYVQTPTGPLPITGVFTARINHELSLVFDTAEPVDTSAQEFNALKQGVM